MIAVANADYRAISLDFRGYGLSEHPSEPEKATFNDFVDDVVALLDSLGISKVPLLTLLICERFTITRSLKDFINCLLVSITSKK